MIDIKNENELNSLIYKIKHGEKFYEKFKFVPYELRHKLLEKLDINKEVFEKNFIYYNQEKKLHISESEFEYILISTLGLVMFSEEIKKEEDKLFYSFESQYAIMEIIIEKVLELSIKPDIYDIDSYNYEYLCSMKIGLFHNYLFYLELFAKTYLALNGEKMKNTHKTETILSNMKSIMYAKYHNDTLFHLYIIPEFENTVKYLTEIPGEFREQYIKYNDNMEDTTSIILDNIDSLYEFIKISDDILSQFYYEKEESHYFKQGLYNRILSRTKNDYEKSKVKEKYQYLIQH